MTEPTTASNFFLLLDLDPDQPWDQARFEKALLAKRTRWSRDSSQGVGARKAAAQDHLKLVDMIKEQMKDPAKRKAQADAARTARAADHQQLRDRFLADLTIQSAKGYLLEQEVTQLIKTFGAVLSEAEVRKQISVRIRADSPDSTGPTTLDPTKKKMLRDLVDRVGKRDLYDFLATGLGDNVDSVAEAATAVLIRAANSIYQEAQNNAHKTSEVGARAELAGYCMDLFASTEKRALYDATLREEAFDGLLERVDLVGRVPKMIHASQVKQLLEEARKNGLDVEEARARIIARANKNGWAIEVPATELITEQQRCGNCGELNQPSDRHCAVCGKALAEPCPRCLTTLPSDASACQACGFPIGNRSWVRFLLEDSRRLEETSQYAAALAQVEQATEDWPATKASELADEIGARRRDLESLVRRREQSLDQVGTLIASRSFYTAQKQLAALEQLSPSADPQVAALRAQIDRPIAEAEAHLAEVRRSGRSGEDAAMVYQQVLRLCDDSTLARELLSRTPPAPPRSLVAEIRGQVIGISWQPSQSSDVQYVVIRKAHAHPSAPADGTRLALVKGTRFDDAAPEVGVPLFYAVFADREGVPSPDAAHLSVPVLALRDVQGLTARVNERQVHLVWEPPTNVRRVFAVRSADGRTPRGPEDGVWLEALDNRQVLDRDLEDGREYHYTIYCEFDDVDKRALSAGITITATPQAPPRPIDDLTITSVASASARRTRIAWSSPTKGEARILRTAQSLDRAGQVVPAEELQQYGQNLIASAPLFDSWVGLEVRYYTAAIVFGGMAYLGRSHRYVCLDDIDHAQAQNLGSLIRVTWNWPAGCVEARLSYSHTGWPEVGDQAADSGTHANGQGTTTVRVSRAEYDRGGSFDLRQPAAQDYYLVVQASTSQNGETILAPGTSPGARAHVRVLSKVTVEYEIRRPALGRRAYLLLRTGKKTTLPSLVLLRKQGALPLSRQDGECVLRVEGPCRVDRELRIGLTTPENGHQSYVKLFLEDDGLYESINVLHPERDRLRF